MTPARRLLSLFPFKAVPFKTVPFKAVFPKAVLSSAVMLVAVAAAVTVLSGCDRLPAPPANAAGDRVKVLMISPMATGEIKAAANVEAAKMNYRYRLDVLKAYYDKVGNADKYLWAGRELKNLQDAWTFTFAGLPPIKPPAGESLANADEKDLVEYVFAARAKYRQAVADLEDYYRQHRRDFEVQLIKNVEARFDPVRTYMYYFAAELPQEKIRPTAVIPAADALFADGVRLFKQGKGLLHMALTTNYDTERRALLKFLELVRKYPTSNKTPESCYYIGEIYKEYFNENLRAVNWYQKAWTLDPDLQKPARFQAATVYDLRLQDKQKAVECYRMAIEHEQFNASNVRYSHQRIEELTSAG